MFGSKKQRPPEPSNAPDEIFQNLPRGVPDRASKDDKQPQGKFATAAEIAAHGFRNHAGDNFIGVVGGKTEDIPLEDGRIERVTSGGTPIGLRDDRHRTLMAGSRSGKGRCVLVPELLTNIGSAIVVDCKGENASITARYRAEKMGHNVSILDPFRIVTDEALQKYQHQFNPLDAINMENKNFVEDAGSIADAIVVPMDSKDSHWDSTAKAFIEAVILYVGYIEDYLDDERTLVRVGELISGKHHDSIDDLLDEMADEEGLDGRIAAGAIALREKSDGEKASVLSNARKNLKFLDYDAMASVLGKSDFSLHDLKEKPMTVYLVLPATRLSTCKQWLRLFVNLTLASIEAVPARPKYPVQLLLDEMATLGKMQELESAIGQMAGLGLRVTSVLQDLGQLKSMYGDRFESFLANSGIIQCFGNVDAFTSNWVSKYLGKTTLRVESKGSTSIDASNQGTSGVSYRDQVQELMTPEEVRQFFAREDPYNRQLVFVAGKKPYITQRVNYDQHELFEGRFDRWR